MSGARRWLPSLAFGALALAAGQAMAQIKTDDTLGREPRELQGPDYAIGSELGRIKGGNLFHSFDHFSLRTPRESATFRGPNGINIANVISRVTGGQISQIEGTIRSEIPGADFYFLNPAGVVFGPKAQLDVQGSLHVSTAHELRFSDGAKFSASNPDGSSFTSAPPESFGFLDRSAGSITLNRADLAVSPDESVTLSGSEVVIDRGSIFLPELFGARNGAVTLVAMAQPGAVAVADGDTSAAPEGKVRMTGEGRKADGSFAGDGVQVSSFGGGGVVRIRAGAFVVEGAEIHADNAGDAPGTAMIDITADRVRLTAGADIRSIAFGQGDAGDVRVSAGELDVLSGSLLRSDTRGVGNAGAVSVLDARRVRVSREGSGRRTDISSSVEPAAQGRGGSVTVNANDIMVTESATIFSISRGAGRAGAVTVTGDLIALLTGGQVASGTLGQSTGRGGNVTVTMRQELVIAGQSAQINPNSGMREPSGTFTSTESRSAAAGPAGRVLVEAPVIRLADRGEIASESMNPDEDGTNPADSGSVEVRFVDLLEVDDAEITTQAEISNAGDITIRGRGVIDVRNGGEISTTVFQPGSGGNAGDIKIDPRFIILDGGRIQANGRRGRGGNIRITVDNLIQSPDSVIEALSQEGGIEGTVVISTPEADVSSGLVVLEGVLLDAASQLRERCGARRDIGASSFTGVGRGGLPPGPDAPLAGYLGRAAADGAPPAPAMVALPEPPRSPSGTWAVAAVAPCVRWPEPATSSP